MKVLVVEDDGVKYGNLAKVLTDSGVNSDTISHRVNAADAVSLLLHEAFDLMLLDVNVPLRNGEGARRGGGLAVLEEVKNNVSLHRPRYVVGVTAYEDVVAEFESDFVEDLWSLVHYREDVDSWARQIKALVHHIDVASSSRNFSDGRTFGFDVAVVCALPDVELAALRKIDLGWSEFRLAHDESRYFTGAIDTATGPKSIIAVAAPRMGMPATAALAAKVVVQFRPALLGMVGICAGRNSKSALGDVIVAEQAWDYGSGKIEGTAKGPKFSASAHQIGIDPELAELARELSRETAWLSQLRASFQGKVPETELKIRVGPMASGAAVVAHKAMFDELVARQRDVLAVEMEAYGLFAAALGSGKPRPRCLVVKAVSDFADKKKNDDFQPYAAFASANVFLELVKRDAG